VELFLKALVLKELGDRSKRKKTRSRRGRKGGRNISGFASFYLSLL
jgi:hypothetical protein